MPLFDIDLSNGQTVSVEADHQPTEQEAIEALKKYASTNKTSALGTALRSAATAIAPAVGGAVSWGVGAELAPETGGLSLAIPALSALAGSTLTSMSQKDLLTKLAPQLQEDIETGAREHPLASLGGELAGSAGVFKIAPGQAIRGLAAIPSILKGTGTEAQFAAAKVASLQAGMGAGLGAVQPLVQGRLPTWADVGQGALGMAIFGEPRSKMLLPRAAAAVRDARLRDITRQAQPQPTVEESVGEPLQQPQRSLRRAAGGGWHVIENGKQITTQPLDYKSALAELGDQNASSQQEATEVHGDVRTQPEQGVRKVPAEEGGQGVLALEAPKAQVLLSPQHEQILNDVLTAESKEGKKIRLVDAPFDQMDPLTGALGTIDRSTGEIILNKEELGRLAQDYPKLDMRHLLERLIAHENIHLHTSDEDAVKYWNNLWNWERMFTKRRVSGTWHGERMSQGGETIEMNDTHWGHEALRYRLEQLSGMQPSEFAAAVGRERFTLKMIDGLDAVVRNIRQKFTSRGGMDWEIINHIQDNLEAGRMVLTGQATPQEIESNPFMLRKGREDRERQQELFTQREMTGIKGFGAMRAAAEGDQGAMRRAAKAEKKDAVAEAETQRLERGEEPLMRRKGRPTRDIIDRGPGIIGNVKGGVVNAKNVPVISGTTHAVAGFQVPGTARWRYHEDSNVVSWTDTPRPDDMDAVDNYLNRKGISPDEHQSHISTEVKYRTGGMDTGGILMRRKGRPPKDPYEPGQSKFAIPGMPGQRPVAGKEEAERTYGELKLKAAPGVERDVMERSVEGLIPQPPTAAEWDNIAQDYLNTPIKSTTTSRELPGKGPTPFTSYDRPNYDDFVRKNSWLKPGQAKDLWQDSVWKNLIHAPASRLQQWADALGIGFTDVSREGETRIPEPAAPPKFKLEGEDKRPAAEKKEERERKIAQERFRSRVVMRIAEKLIGEAFEGAQPLDRTSLEHNDIAFSDSRTEFGPYVEISADAAKDPEAIKKIVADRSRPSSAAPYTQTKRLIAMVNDEGGVAVVSAYVAPDGKLMMVKPGETGERPNREYSDAAKGWKPFASVLLEDPVQNFLKRYDSVKHFEDSIDSRMALDKSAAGRYEDVYGDEFTAERVAPEPERRSYRIWGSEPTEQPLGTEIEEESGANLGRTAIEEGQGGMFMGPHAELVREGRGGAVQRARALGTRDVTATEAGSLYNLITGRVKQPYTAESLKGLESYLGKRWADDKLSPSERAAIIALQKIDASVRRRMPKATPDVTHQAVWDQLKAIMAFTEDEAGFTQEVIRNFTTPTAEGAFRPRVEPPSQTQRELTMRERRPPTDVAGLPEGQARPLPEATGLGGRPQELGQVPPSGPEAFRPDVGLSPETQAALARRNITISPYASGLRPGQRPTTVGRPPGFRMAREPQMPGTARFGKKVAYDLRRQHEMIGAIIRRADRVRDMAAQMDVQDNLANIAGDNTVKHLDSFAISPKYPKGGDPEIMSSGIAVISTGAWYYDESAGKYAFNNRKFDKLKDFQGSLNVGEQKARKMIAQGDWRSKQIGARWLEAVQAMRKEVDYAEEHWKDKGLQSYALEMKKELDKQITKERDSGRNIKWKDNYFPGRYDGEFFDDSTIRFGDNLAPLLGQRFSARKVFNNYYEAIGAGPYIPASRDGSAIVGHRIRQGDRSLNRSSWTESLKGWSDPESGEPVAMNSLVFEEFDPKDPNKVTGHRYQPPTPEYVDMVINGQHISVRRSYERVVKDLTLTSAVRDIPALRFALETGQRIKHGILALDIFHPMRLMYYNAAIKGGLPGYIKGSSVLEYRPSDLTRARDMGLITPEAYEWATERIQLKAGDITMNTTRTEIVQELLQAGLNVGRIQDAIYKELVSNIPFVGEALSKYNRFIFDKVTRGFMVENAVGELIRLNHENPNVRLENVARQVSKDINTFYGNLGRQGWFRSQTAQDLSRIAFLAPMWVEGLIKKEAAFVSRPVMKGVNMAMGNKTAPLNDTVMRGIGRGLVASFALTQIINLMTRQKPTWQNEEEGHKWDAWVPNMSKEKGPGFFISPLSIFADISHDIIRMFESKPNAWEGIRQMGDNKLGPWGRMAVVMWSQRSPTGTYLPTTGKVALSAASQLLPVPISGSKLGQQALSYTGLVRPPPPGSVQRQAMASLGIKTEVGPTVVSQMQHLANKFVTDNNLRTEMVHIEAIDNPSYAKLRGAIEAGDDAYATRMYGKLRDMGVDDKKIINEMRRWAKHPFTGSNASERKFLHSLNDQDLNRYASAMQEKQATLEKFYDWYLKKP